MALTLTVLTAKIMKLLIAWSLMELSSVKIVSSSTVDYLEIKPLDQSTSMQSLFLLLTGTIINCQVYAEGLVVTSQCLTSYKSLD